MLRLRYDPTRTRWHERLVRFDARQQAWVPWHWRRRGGYYRFTRMLGPGLYEHAWTEARWTSWLGWGR